MIANRGSYRERTQHPFREFHSRWVLLERVTPDRVPGVADPARVEPFVMIVSREEAKSNGLRRFFTGDPCKNGHVAERYTKTGHCTECLGRSARPRAWKRGRDPRELVYRQQELNARKRGIPWLFTFETWWSIWDKSGHWNERGRDSHQYCMSRFDDKGVYEASNVSIATNNKNRSERNRNYPPSEKQREAIKASNTARSGPNWRGNQWTR